MLGKSTLSYGKVKEQHLTRWIFWNKQNGTTPEKFVVEVSNTTGTVLSIPSNFSFLSSAEHLDTFCNPLGIDWLVKAFPYPILFAHALLLKPIIERRVTNPMALAQLIVSDELSAKVSPRMFYRNVLSQPFFDSWDKINVALLLLMVAQNAQTTLERIEKLTLQYARNYQYFRYINLAYYCKVKADCCIAHQKLSEMLELLSKENTQSSGDVSPIRFNNSYDSTRELLAGFHDYAINLKSFPSLSKKPKPLYTDSLTLPKGINLIDSPAALAAEGKKMRNCVASYTRELMAKRSFFLHVSGDEKVTVQVEKNSAKRRFEITQIKGVANVEVSKETVNRVRKAISTFDAQRFFFLNYRKKSNKRKNIQSGPTLFDGLEGWE